MIESLVTVIEPPHRPLSRGQLEDVMYVLSQRGIRLTPEARRQANEWQSKLGGGSLFELLVKVGEAA